MRDAFDDWQARGTNVVLIGNGAANFAEAFREDYALEVPVLVDPERVAYRAAGLRRNAAGIVNPRFLSNAARALRSGARQTGVEGDAWQLGGVFVFSADGDLTLAARAEAAGDLVTAEEIEAALGEEAPNAEAVERSPALVSLASAASKVTRPVLDLSPVGSFDAIGFARHAAAFAPEDLDVDLYGQRCLVTGANSGIGFATSLALADLGAEVVLLCRSPERGEAAAQAIRTRTGSRRVSVVRLDVSDLDDVDRVLPTLAAEPVDVLVHNAGVLPDVRSESAQGLESTFATHVAGPHRLTAGLREALAADGGGRVIWVSSGGMLTRRLQVEDPQWTQRDYDGVLAYAETKRAQVVLAELWAEELEGEGVQVNSMHPGWADTPAVATSLPRFHEVTSAILRSPEEGADSVVWLAASSAAGSLSGRFIFDREAVRTHWLPTTRESAADRDQFRASLRAFEGDA